MPRRTPAGPSARKPATRQADPTATETLLPLVGRRWRWGCERRTVIGYRSHPHPGPPHKGREIWRQPSMSGAVGMQDQTKPEAAQAVLVVNNIEVVYDHVILVLKGVSLNVPQGGVVALLGANGAGKTTTLKAISNLLRAERGEVTKGTIELAGRRITALSPSDLVKLGVVQVMEGRHCFEHLTVEENLLTGAYTRSDGKAAIEQDLEMVYGYFPPIRERRRAQARYTSGGEQQMIAIGRALMARPKVILLDEPSMGLAPQLVEEIFEIVARLNAEAG